MWHGIWLRITGRFFPCRGRLQPEKAIFVRTFEFVPTRCSVNHSFVTAENYDSIDLTIESFGF
ncbi:MAG: hypothetical protein CMJ56_04765 [Planctomycetaceae bacterium]|nr:hypothetical protein [Planctomycetaceae bacterium]